MKIFVTMLTLLCAIPALAASNSHLPDRSQYSAPKAAVAPRVDGMGDDAVWSAAPWRAIDNRWLGPEFAATDFKGRYKVAWTEQRLYLLVEVIDDVVIDTHRDPLVQYWDDDCLEIFIDEDHSGGDHQYNHNAFAYHFSLDNRAIDIGTDQKARDYTHHVESEWRQSKSALVWEVSIEIYGDDYVDGATDNTPKTLTAGKLIGLMVAYCDNDGSELRENFIGSETVPVGPKDRGWIDAGLFGSLTLVE